MEQDVLDGVAAEEGSSGTRLAAEQLEDLIEAAEQRRHYDVDRHIDRWHSQGYSISRVFEEGLWFESGGMGCRDSESGGEADEGGD